MIALPILLLALGAPRTPYGGSLVAYVWGRPPALLPGQLATAADLTIQRALYEPLYSIDRSGKVVPNLAAELPQFDGRRVTIGLRPNLTAHDGTPLTAARVAEWLTSFARRDSRAAYVVLPIAGARDRIAGKDTPLRIAALDDHTLLIELAHLDPELARLFASPHAGIGVPGGAGTGPFRRDDASAKGELILVPFLEHFVGRPFLDRIELRPLGSRFGTSAIAKKDPAALVFETPDSGRADVSRALRWPELAGPEVLVLSIGSELAAKRSALVTALDAAVNRPRLASRYLEGDAQPALAFAGKREAPKPLEPMPETIDAELLVAKEARAGHRFAERVQLDLHRAGVIVRIERKSAEEIEATRMSGRYQLLLDVVLPAAPLTSRTIDRLHALLSIGASYGRADFAGAELLDRFFAAKEEQRAPLLAQVEAELVRQVGLIPLASRAPAVAARDDLVRIAIAPDGAVDLAGASLREEPR